MSNIPTIYADEALLVRWGDSSTSGRTITLQLQEHGDHPFRGLPSGKNGQRVMIAVTLIGDDEQPVPAEAVRREKSPADKAIAKAHVLAGETSFADWVNATTKTMVLSEVGAMAFIRQHCGVQSTTEFRADATALRRFDDLCWEYEHRQVIR